MWSVRQRRQQFLQATVWHPRYHGTSSFSPLLQTMLEKVKSHNQAIADNQDSVKTKTPGSFAALFSGMKNKAGGGGLESSKLSNSFMSNRLVPEDGDDSSRMLSAVKGTASSKPQKSFASEILSLLDSKSLNVDNHTEAASSFSSSKEYVGVSENDASEESKLKQESIQKRLNSVISMVQNMKASQSTNNEIQYHPDVYQPDVPLTDHNKIHNLAMMLYKHGYTEESEHDEDYAFEEGTWYQTRKSKSTISNRHILIQEDMFDKLSKMEMYKPMIRSVKIGRKKSKAATRDISYDHAILAAGIRRYTLNIANEKIVVKIPPSLKLKEASQLLSILEFDLRQILRTLGMNIPLDSNPLVFASHLTKICQDMRIPHTLVSFRKTDADFVDFTQYEQVRRPLVVSVMGHVNHGKTTLLDLFRKKKVAPKEIGGITQSVASFTTQFSGQDVTFFDTPGHSIFNEMRLNVAKVTDLVVLIIDVNEGLRPQTMEALRVAVAHGIPVLVALNKCDLLTESTADQVIKIKDELFSLGVELEDMGGEVQAVMISAKTGEGIEQLQEAILLAAELMEPKAPIESPAEAVVVETRFEPGKGHIALCIVRCGVLKLRDNIVCGMKAGVARVLYDWDGNQLKQAGPSCPVLLRGIDGGPEVGDIVQVVESGKKAKDVIHCRLANAEEQKQAQLFVGNYTQLHLDKMNDTSDASANAKTELSVIVKADQAGSLQSLMDYLYRIPSFGDIVFRVIKCEVGDISTQDIELAKVSGARIIGFGVSVSQHSKKLLKDYPDIPIATSKLIYDLLDPLCSDYLKLIPDQYELKVVGKATVKQVFSITVDKNKTNIAGCGVTKGVFERLDLSRVRVRRKGVIVGEGQFAELRLHKAIVDLVQAGSDCGVRVDGFEDLQEGDELECIHQKLIPKTVSWITQMVEESRAKDAERVAIATQF